MKWRLDKHEKAHTLENIKFCHYFNNEKNCPYEEVGCMFKHEQSQVCRYKDNCSNKLCQFHHRKKKPNNEKKILFKMKLLKRMWKVIQTRKLMI